MPTTTDLIGAAPVPIPPWRNDHLTSAVTLHESGFERHNYGKENSDWY